MTDQPVSPLRGEVIASYLVRVTLRSEDGDTKAPSIEDVEEAIETTFISITGGYMVRASAERTDI